METGNKKMGDEPQERRNDYLWDGSGEPDPEIQQLEKLLVCFRHNRPPSVFPQTVPETRGFFPWRIRLFPVLATASALAVIAGAVFLIYGNNPAPVLVAGWNVSRVAGTPLIGSESILGHNGTGRLVVGQMLETDVQSRARLEADYIGRIEVEPRTRLRLLSFGAGLERIALDRGTIHTHIWAAPGRFVVDTPSAMTVDLGCAYTLHVDDSGSGTVRTSRGWVGFKLNGHEAFIPAGAVCSTRPKTGPGTPYFEDASPKLRAALARFDFEDTTAEQRAADVAAVISESRKRDALTLWHLLARVDEGQRGLVFARLRGLAPPPAGVTQNGVHHLDQAMLDRWWNKLGFDDISVWRHWERNWSGAAAPQQ